MFLSSDCIRPFGSIVVLDVLHFVCHLVFLHLTRDHVDLDVDTATSGLSCLCSDPLLCHCFAHTPGQDGAATRHSFVRLLECGGTLEHVLL